jgi:hypothetical protein
MVSVSADESAFETIFDNQKLQVPGCELNAGLVTHRSPDNRAIEKHSR